MNWVRVPKIVKEIKFEGVWGKLEAETNIEKVSYTDSSSHVK